MFTVYNLNEQHWNDLNHRLRQYYNSRNQAGYLQKFHGLNYQKTTTVLANIASHFNDSSLLKASCFMSDFYERTNGDIMAVRFASEIRPLQCENFEPDFAHLQDWALQGYEEPFARINPSHQYQKISQINKQPAVSWYLFNQYPSYPKKYIEFSHAHGDAAHLEAQAQNTRDLMLNNTEIHGLARALGLRLDMLDDVEATFARIAEMRAVVTATNNRRTKNDWSLWWNRELLPWLNDLAGRARETNSRGGQKGPTFEKDVTTFIHTCTTTKNLVAAMGQYEHQLANKTWAQLRAEIAPTLVHTAYNDFYLAESLRLLSLMLGYFKSNHFKNIPVDNKNTFLIDFFLTINEASRVCQAGFFERFLLGFQKKLFNLHKDNVDPGFQGAQDVFEQMLSFALKEDSRDITKKNLIPSVALHALFMRVLKLLEQPQEQQQDDPWAPVLQSLRANPTSLPAIQKEDFFHFPQHVQRFYQIKNNDALTQDDNDFLERLPPQYSPFFEEHSLDHDNILSLESRLNQIGFTKDFKKEEQELFLSILSKKQNLYQLKNRLREQILENPSYVRIAGADGLENDLMSLLTADNQCQAAQTVTAKLKSCAHHSNDNALIREVMRVQSSLLKECRKETRFDRQNPVFQQAHALCQKLARGVVDKSFEAELTAFLGRKLIPATSAIAGALALNQTHCDIVTIACYETEQLPRVSTTVPNLHDFLREAQRLSGLPRAYLKTVLSLLGSPTKDLLTKPDSDPFDGEERSLYRGLEILNDGYQTIVHQGPLAHKSFLSDNELLKQLLEHHQVTAQSYYNVPQEKKVLLEAYYGMTAQALPLLQNSFESLSDITRHPTAIMAVLQQGEVDLAADILLKWQKSLNKTAVKRDQAIFLCRNILDWIHLHQYYRLFTPLLELCCHLEIKKDVFDKDFLCHLTAFHEGQALLPLLHTLQINEALMQPTAQLYHHVGFSSSYLKMIMMHWETHFSQLLEKEELLKNLPAGQPQDYPEQLQKAWIFLQIKHGFLSKEMLEKQAGSPTKFYLEMMEYAIENNSAETAMTIFDAWIASSWKNASALTIVNDILAPLIVDLLYHPISQSKQSVLDHIADWLSNNHQTEGLILDFTMLPAEKLKKPLTKKQLKKLHELAQLFAFNAVVMPPLKLSASTIRKQLHEFNSSSADLQSPKLFYSAIGKFSLKTLLLMLYEKVKNIFEYLAEKVKSYVGPLDPQTDQQEEQAMSQQGTLLTAEQAFEQDGGVAGVYKKHRELRFQAVSSEVEALNIMKKNIRY